MHFRTIILAAAVAATCGVIGASPVRAQEREIELRRLHHECDAGDRKACVRFGEILGEERAHRERWRREHPEWFWWEH
jgi:hypothetical protein